MHEKNPPFNGFNRILVSAEGEAYSPDRARHAKIYPMVGFLRDDGWSIGAPEDLEVECKLLWPKEWTHFIRAPFRVWEPIADYKY